MNELKFDEQLKHYRKKHGLSQEELAGKIYVSRQTVSNWETKRSFPDIHNLLLLSVLFEVSLDDLVKGELEEMKNSRDVRNYKMITNVRNVFIITAVFAMILGRHYFGDYFSVIIGVAALLSLAITRYLLRRIEIKHTIQNSIHDPKESHEVLLFLENPKLTQEKLQEKREKERTQQRMKSIILAFSFFAFIVFSAYISRVLT